MARRPRDSTPDSSSPQDDAPPSKEAPSDDVTAASEARPADQVPPPADEASPPEDAPAPSEDVAPPKPAKPPKPAAPERLNTIDVMPSTLIGMHLPPLLEEEAAKRAAQTSPVAPAPEPQPTKSADPVYDPASDDPQDAWRSPLETRPAWLIALASVPRNMWVMAGGGLVAGLLLVTAARGCVGKGRIDDLEKRVAVLERTTGVNPDAGMGTSGDPPTPSANAPPTSGGKSTASAATTADDSKQKDCAVAKLAAYQAWQGAIDKAKALAAPAEAKCTSLWTDSKKQACYGAALQSVRSAESARNASIKGGAAARDAVKKVRDDPTNDAIGRARAASSSAFDACQDENEL
jgi:hypothetical protein